jgi:phage terminase large subunit-like protein
LAVVVSGRRSRPIYAGTLTPIGCGTFNKLEDQLCSLTEDFNAKEMGFSPDRADAAIWALSYLMEGAETARPFFFSVNL